MNRWHWLVLVVALLAVAVYWLAAIPGRSTPSGSTSQARFAPGPYAVITDSFKAVDESRPTQANNDFAGRPVRVLKGKLWRPQGLSAPGPLLVYSHGFMSFHQEGTYLVRFLASHGYTVVAVDYPLTNFFAPGKPLVTDVVNQPGDVSFLISTVLQRNEDPADPLHQTIDPQRIAVAGVSLGGMTSTLAAYHRKVRDPRITAAISIAGPGTMFTEHYFAGSPVPYLMIYGDGDAIIPYDRNAAPLPARFPGSTLVTLRHASHAGFAQAASTFMRFFANPDGIGCREVRKGLKNRPAGATPQAFLPGLDAPEDGIDLSDRSEPCTTPLIPEAMPAARQHMFTILAAHAFLESVFARDASQREQAQAYLLHGLAADHPADISVTRVTR